MAGCEHCYCQSGKGYTDNWMACCKCGHTKPMFECTKEEADALGDLCRKLARGEDIHPKPTKDVTNAD
jgi:hypothetical protein